MLAQPNQKPETLLERLEAGRDYVGFSLFALMKFKLMCLQGSPKHL